MVFLLFFATSLLFFSTRVQAEGSENIFIVKRVGVRVPQSKDSAINARTSGLMEAQKVAFKHLLQRMLTKQERQTRNPFIQDIGKNIKELLQRSIIVSERQAGRELELSVDIHFEKEKVRQSFEMAGLSFTETFYPTTLFLPDENLLAAPVPASIYSIFLKAVNVYGFELVQPIRDVEDLSNLSMLENPSQIDPFKNWVRSRYRADKIWKLSGEGYDSLSASEDGMQNTLRWKLVEYSSDGVSYHFAKVFQKNKETKNNLKKKELENAALAMVERIVNPWIAGHVVLPGLDTFLDVSITNTRDMEILDEMTKKIESFTGIDSVAVIEMSSNHVKLRIRYKGNEIEVRDQLTKIGAVDQGQGSAMFINLP
ncbi:MAG TPA: DUF2066 domain-containing protein [Magnetococcales bacterium]|nr:DUF2066 domain-containing protein [Magnetococcales bacterium]